MVIATGFHQSSILLIIIPFLTFLRFNRIGIIILICAFFVGRFLQSQLGDVFALFEVAEGMSNKLDEYLEGDYMTQNHNLNYFILQVFPLIIYPILSLVYLKRNSEKLHILRFEPILMIALMFQIMQFSIDIMYRYIYALSPYYIIFIVQYFIDSSKNPLRMQKSLSFVRTFMIVLPLLASIAYLWKPFTHPDFNPYSSVIERSIDDDREKYYSGLVYHYNLNLQEY